MLFNFYRECPDWFLFYDIRDIDLKNIDLLPFFSDITLFADGVFLNKHQLFIDPHDTEFTEKLINIINSFSLYYGCGEFSSNNKFVTTCILINNK